MTNEFFKKYMGFMCAYFGKELQPEIMGLYWQMLKHLSDNHFELSVKNVCAEFIPTAACPFPIVAHILKYCGETGDNKAISAISRLKKALRVGPYQSVCFKDPTLHYIVHVNGGWPAMCNWTGKEWDVNEGRLLEAYKSSCILEKDGPDHLSGLAERENGYFSLFILGENEGVKEIKCRGSVPELTFSKTGKISYGGSL